VGRRSGGGWRRARSCR